MTGKTLGIKKIRGIGLNTKCITFSKEECEMFNIEKGDYIIVLEFRIIKKRALEGKGKEEHNGNSFKMGEFEDVEEIIQAKR